MNKVTKVTPALPFARNYKCKRVPNIASDAPVSTIEEKEKSLAPGWKSQAPFLNAWAKVFPTETKPIWMLVWVKEDSAYDNDSPVPKLSSIYRYITSQCEEKQKILVSCERVLVGAFKEAKEFIGQEKDVQGGFEIVRRNDFIMTVEGFLGIEVNYKYVDALIRAIEENNLYVAAVLFNMLKASFAHEMVHYIRDEIKEDKSAGQEVASQAVEILVCGGTNPMKNKRIEEAIKEPDDEYEQDIVAAAKVVQKKLTDLQECLYKPKSFKPDELNKAMQSISKEKREELLKKIAQEIIKTSPVDLLRLAAISNVVQFKLPEEEAKSELEAVS